MFRLSRNTTEPIVPLLKALHVVSKALTYQIIDNSAAMHVPKQNGKPLDQDRDIGIEGQFVEGIGQPQPMGDSWRGPRGRVDSEITRKQVPPLDFPQQGPA